MAVYKDKKRGTWYASVMYKDWTGKQCRKLKRGFATKKVAQDWEQSFAVKEASNLDMTFEEFVSVYERDVRPKLKENTWLSKEHVIQTKLLPYFKRKRMCDITSRDITQWQNEMLTKTSVKGTAYANTYLKTLQSQLSSIFNHAVRLYELHSNPVQKAGPLGMSTSDEMQFWTKEEYLQFIPVMATKIYSYLAFELLYWCGMRMGELRALSPGDFDFNKKTISITKSYQKIKGRDVVTVPKTKNSIRTIVMPEQVATEMKDFLDSIYGIQATDRIFTFTKSYLHHEMDRGAKASGVIRIRVHDLRHSHVSLLINMGFSALAIGNRVGHESEKITYRNWLMFEQGLQPNTLDNVHTQLHPMFELAVRDDIIRKNPSDGVMAEIKKNSAAFRRKRHALTAPQQKAFMNHLCENYEFHGWEPVITVLLGTGMRIGECLGLCWNDLDFEKRIIKVCKTLTYRPEPDNGSVVHISTPKTEAGERTIPMIDEVYDAFLEEYQIQKVLGFGTNEIDGFSNFVFSTGEGNVYTPESVNRAIKRIYEDYNKGEEEVAKKQDREPLLLPHFSAHHLRHTFCTRLCENESNLKVIQSVMGHSDITTTMDIYAECTAEKKQEVFATLNGKIMVK